MNKIETLDAKRYLGKLPFYQKWFRRAQTRRNPVSKMFYKVLYYAFSYIRGVGISPTMTIGYGLYISHPFGITVNKNAIIGNNVNLSKGVTIGQENRGKRIGCPVIGDRVWIGVNATIVGNIKIGDDVLIAPNSLVNRDIPDHSIVIGNPCIVKPVQEATIGYINNIV